MYIFVALQGDPFFCARRRDLRLRALTHNIAL
jgi:hypothetical protein